MIKNLESKLLYFIISLFFIYIFLNLIYVKNLDFRKFINNGYSKIEKIFFATPALYYHEIESKLLLEEKNMSRELSYLEREINESHFLNFSKKNIKIESHKYNGRNMKAVAFIDFFEDKLFIVNGVGKISFTNIADDNSNNNFEMTPILSNIKDIIKNEFFYEIGTGSRRSQFDSISDILIHDNFIYLSFNRLVKDNCYTKSIIRSKIDFNFLKFEDFFFNENECREYDKNKKRFNGHQSGGRMIYIDKESPHNIFNSSSDKLLFSVGDFRSSKSKNIPLAGDDRSIFGKILLIDLENQEYRVFSKGHRNPQGLYYDKKNKIILSTEHGPYGGDEINLISSGKNYGWPISSYGENYPDNNKDRVKDNFEFKKSHSDFGYEEPIFAFTKSLGISEIIKVPDDFNHKWKNSFLAATLNGHIIVRFNLDNTLENLQTAEFIYVGERIRDIKIFQNKIYAILENSAELAIYSIE